MKNRIFENNYFYVTKAVLGSVSHADYENHIDFAKFSRQKI